ncbi:TonB-dependent receptor [Pontibacter silvestris]|uniref:TonB-dependent receptor n=1 Tax=Pontibacter silvestris TaxID=2305183 RepID=A0ABW4WTZ2_9BACT|nr:TonB-dependent receptor [Pontibacter silvestris]MCC9138411.1 TonB-dependent receptor [Pontibacter silvestris]
MKRHILYSFILFLLPLGLKAQKNDCSISGIVRSQEGKALHQLYVYLQNSSYFTETAVDGSYKLSVPAGEYYIICSGLGYEKKIVPVTLKPGQKLEYDFTLALEPDMVFEEVEIVGKSALQDVKESAYNVVAVDAKALHNTTMDVSQALERVSGVRVRQTGGVGSEVNLSLNGFSGRHVKFFIDGVPMEGFGSAFQINNLPVNMAERIEVYKGVVPISFGSDALGGAINIVTNDRTNSFLDASYSFGSFNTHKSYVNAGYTSKSGFTANINAFQNYSDNNYWVSAKILDLEGNLFLPEKQRVRRFHDKYHNETVIAKFGVVNKPFADRLLLGFTWGNEYDEIQHPADMSFAYGERFKTAETLMPSLLYTKSNLFAKNLNVSLSANYNFGGAMNVDTARVRYNWLGEHIERKNRGELAYSLYKYHNRNGAANANLTYTFLGKHAFTLNNVLSTFSRTGHNEAEPSPIDDYPRETIKNVLGVGYKFDYSEKWSTSFFLKHYKNTVNTYADPDGGSDYQNFKLTTENDGYGVASTYFLRENLQLKASYEKTYRLPTGRELFGSGDGVEVGNVSLSPENSDNFNLGLNYSFIINDKHAFTVDGSFIYRNIKDYIRREISQTRGTAQSINEGLVRNMGVDAEVRYSYGKLFTIGGTVAFQDIRNKLKYQNNRTVVSTTYNDRVPNVPYLYGNGDFTFFLNDAFRKGNTLSLSYNLLYVHQFYYDWPSYGGITIPTQLSHDLYFTYGLKQGRYNLSLECKNILNEDLYDNYSLQRPGRSFSAKVRYFISK